MDLMKLQNLLNECIMIEQGNYLGGKFSVDLKEAQQELDEIKQLLMQRVINCAKCGDNEIGFGLRGELCKRCEHIMRLDAM